MYVMGYPLLVAITAVVVGGVAIYTPILGFSWLLKKKRLQDAWEKEPHLLSSGQKEQYVQILFEEAVKSHHASEHEKVSQLCQRILRLNSDDPQASRLLVASLFAAGRFQEAQNALGRHLLANPHDEAAKLVPAAIYCEEGDFVAAREALDEVEPKKLPIADRALWYNNYAYTLLGLRLDLDLAKEYAEKALDIAITADKQFALRTLGGIFLAKREAQQALNCFFEALEYKDHLRAGDLDFTYYYIAKSYVQLEKYTDARQFLDDLIEKEGRYGDKARKLIKTLPPLLLEA